MVKKWFVQINRQQDKQFFWLASTAYKNEHPLLSMGFEEKEKDEKHLGKMLSDKSKVKGVYQL